MSDLFTGPHTGRDNPETSHEAAETIRPALPTIREEVLAFAREHFEFTDEELVKAYPDTPESSYRKRRSELTEEGWILDSGQRRKNEAGNNCIVWVHRSRHPNPPPLGERLKATKEDRTRAAGLVPQVNGWARQMRSEGRTLFADGLEDVARLLDKLAQ